MIGDVAMQHPIAWIVGDKCNIDSFGAIRRIGPLPIRNRGSIAAQHAEAMAVQMNWMRKGRVVRTVSRQLRPRCNVSRGSMPA